MNLKRFIKWVRQWSFLCLLLVSGVIYLTYTDSWHVIAKGFGQENGAYQDEIWRQDDLEKDSDKENSEKENSGEGALDDSLEKFFAETTFPDEFYEEVSPEDVLAESEEGTLYFWEPSDYKYAVEKPKISGEVKGSKKNKDKTSQESGSKTDKGDKKDEELTYRDPEDIIYVNVDDNYFSDALFMGDSRTVGMYEYGGLKDIATFYASTGLNIHKLLEAEIAEVPGQKEKLTVEAALQEYQFEKIYLMIGINEMGTGTVESFMKKYREVVTRIQELQPGAIIYLQGIMKVTTERSQKGDYIHNEGIEARNEEIAKLADNVSIYYLDVNPYICDESGGMEASYTYDGVHLKAQYVTIWKDYLKSHAVDKLLLD